MPIKIQTNFDYQDELPIDSRLVVETLNNLNDIQYKYVGLKVYVIENKITYEYTSTGEWKVDDNFRKKGIYGGSNQIPNDIDVYLGKVDITKESISKKLFNRSKTKMETTSPVRPLGTNVSEYFKRNTNGSLNDTISFMKEFYLENEVDTNNNRVPKVLLSLEFNGKDPLNQQILGSLIFNFAKGAKFVISPKNYFSFYTTNTPETESPITITQIGTNKYFGHNFNPFNTDRNSTYDNQKNSYRIKFGDTENELLFETKLANQNSFISPLKINNLTTSNTNQATPIEILVDTSGRDWDNLSSNNFESLNLTDIMRKTEHRFTKTQMFGQGSFRGFPSLGGSTIDGNGGLALTMDGNSFSGGVPSSTSTVRDIIWVRGGGGGARLDIFPDGTIVTIKFNTGGRIAFLSKTDPSKRNSKIYSEIDEKILWSGDDSFVQFTYRSVTTFISSISPNERGGMMVVLRKMNGIWEVISLDRLRRYTFRIFRKSNIPPSLPLPDWSFTNVYYLNKFDSTGRFIMIGANRSLDNLNTDHYLRSFAPYNPPNVFTYSETSIGERLEVADPSKIDTKWEFQLAISLDFKVNVFGNFRILLQNINTNPTSPNQNFFWTSYGSQSIANYNKDSAGASKDRTNVFRIGKLYNGAYKPLFDTTWTMVKGYARDVADANKKINLIDPILSFTKQGEILLSFGAQPTKAITNVGNLTTTQIDIYIWVPSFNYLSSPI